jgi:hypothetical protein
MHILGGSNAFACERWANSLKDFKKRPVNNLPRFRFDALTVKSSRFMQHQA